MPPTSFPEGPPHRAQDGGVKWDGVGVEEIQAPAGVCSLSVLLAPLPSFLSAMGWEPIWARAASGCLVGCRWVLLKGDFVLPEHPRTTGCSPSKWLLKTASVADHRTRSPSSLVTLKKKPILPHGSHYCLQVAHLLSSGDFGLSPQVVINSPLQGVQFCPSHVLTILLSSFYTASFHLPTTNHPLH